MASFDVKINNKLKSIDKKLSGVSGTVIAMGAAVLQRELMQAAAKWPIRDTGNLINSHQRRKVSNTSWEVTNHAEYAFWVHQGIQNGFGRGVTVPARPWTERGAETARPIITKMVTDTIKKVLG